MSTFSLRRAINQAKEAKHEQSECEKVYICKVCGKEYKTEKGLIKHVETKHKDGE